MNTSHTFTSKKSAMECAIRVVYNSKHFNLYGGAVRDIIRGDTPNDLNFFCRCDERHESYSAMSKICKQLSVFYTVGDFTEDDSGVGSVQLSFNTPVDDNSFTIYFVSYNFFVEHYDKIDFDVNCLMMPDSKTISFAYHNLNLDMVQVIKSIHLKKMNFISHRFGTDNKNSLIRYCKMMNAGWELTDQSALDAIEFHTKDSKVVKSSITGKYFVSSSKC